MNMAISKHEIIKSISLGERVAEDERDSLENYFVQTALLHKASPLSW
jgi:hypothetical protein